MGYVERGQQVTERMNVLDDTREVILGIIAERLSLEGEALEQLRVGGRLDKFTAVDSLLTVELVLLLEEHFKIRFDAEHIDAELISDLDRLAGFIADMRSVS